MPPITEDEKEEAEEKIEEDTSDRLARERAEEQARQEALLRMRSKVLQRSLPRPPAGNLLLEVVKAEAEAPLCLLHHLNTLMN